jgi:PAS domain S-box-containing protein
MEAALVASKSLEQSLAMNQALISSSPLPVVSLDLQGVVVGWNRAAERIFGWTAVEAVGQINPLVPPERAEDFQALREKLGQGEVFAGIERERICKDGRRVPVSIYAAPIVDSSGAILGIVATVEDISARKAAEAEVAIQAQRAQSLLALPQAAEQLSEGEFLQESLKLTEKLTGSAIAFVHFVQPNQVEVELGAWSAQTLEAYCRASYDSHYPVQQAGIWTEPLRTHKPFVLNDYPASHHDQKLPEGHAHLQRFVVVPVLEQGQVVMLMGLGNRADDYRDWEVESVQLMADATWRLVQARRSVASMEAEVLERRRVEAQLRKLALAVEQSPDSIVITDVDAVIDYVNEAFVAASGYAREDVIGQNPRFQHSGHTPPETFAEMWATLAAGNSWDGDFYNRRRNGEIFIERAIIAPLRQPDGAVSHYVAIKHDVTQARLEAEELEQHRLHLEDLVDERTLALNAARLQAENASRAKSAFLANMSHEIRTPMNAILGLVQLLQRDVEAPHLAVRLDKVAGAARHLLAIINDILDLSKIEAGRLELERVDFSVLEVLNHVAAMVADSAAAKDLRLTVSAAEPLPWVRGDVTRVRQALLNYAGNAVKFTKAGFVELSAAVRPLEDGRVEVRMEVADSGIGLSAEQISKLFKPFEQADPSLTRQFGGTGLGLAITRSLALMMGGDTGCTSVEGKGSQFWFTFEAEPIATPDAASSPLPAPKTSGHLKDAGVCLLLVEDNEINREVALDLLRGEGIEVTVAVDGEEAVEHVAARSFDLVLMDVQMPRMDGLAATQAIRQMPGRERMPIVAMTANAFAQDRAACMAAGMNDFVAKPFEIDELIQVLERWLPKVPRRRSQEEMAAQDPRELTQWQRWTNLPGVEPPIAVIRRLAHWQSYETLLRQFAARHGSTGAESWARLHADDLQGLRQLAHSVKGAALTLGIRTVGQSAAAVELACPQSPPRTESPGEPQGLTAADRLDLSRKIEVLEHELGVFARAVEALPEWVDAEAPSQGPPSSPEPTEVQRVVERFAQLLALSDTQVWSDIHKHRDVLKGYLGASFSDFADALGRADFAGALATLMDHKKGGSDDDETRN